MKLITAVIRPTQFDAVRRHLDGTEITEFTLTECHGYERQRENTISLRGRDFGIELEPRLQLQIVVSDTVADAVADAIEAAMDADDQGKLFIQRVEDPT